MGVGRKPLVAHMSLMWWDVRQKLGTYLGTWFFQLSCKVMCPAHSWPCSRNIVMLRNRTPPSQGIPVALWG